MKKLLLAVLAIGVFANVYAQNDSLFYYYQGQKYRVQLSYKLLAIGTKSETSLKQKSFADKFQLPADSVKPSATPGEFFVRPGTAQQGSTFANNTKIQTYITYVHPAIIGQGKKLVTYGDVFIVKLKPGTSVQTFKAFLAKQHVTILRQSAGDKATYQLSAGPQNHYDALKTANTFFESGLFEFAEPDFTTHGGLADVPNDALYNRQWAFKNTGSPLQYNGTPGADMQVDSAWMVTKGDATIKIAVIDTGVDSAQADLKGNLVQGYNCVTQTANPGDGAPLDSTNAHGTGCAGIIAAADNNNIGIAGIAPKCKIMPVNITNSFSVFVSDFAIAAGIDYSWQNGADVLTNSWTIGVPSGAITAAIKRAATQGRGGKGCLVFFATGNDNASINYPSNIPEVIAVGGSNMFNQRKSPNSNDGEYWWGANYGGGLDVVAPCVKIPTTDISSGGGYNTNTGHDGDYTLTFNGTSAAAPHAAAVGALVLSANKNLTAIEARTIIENSCSKVGNYIYALTPGNFSGTWNQEMGYGVVNAYKSVLAAKDKVFCSAGIATPVTTTLCKNGSIKLTVADSSTAATYTWRLNGSDVGTGASFTVTNAGSYDVLANFNNCVATSPAVTIKAADTLPLHANAGPAITICPGNNGVIIGGEPSATGGTPFIAAQRAFGYEMLYGQFIKFSTDSPRSYTAIPIGLKDGVTNTQFVAGDFTPLGYYAVNKASELIRIDTATGNVRYIGTLQSIPGQYTSHNWTGLAWDPVKKQLYGVTSGGLANQLYEIDYITGRAVPTVNNPFSNGYSYWATFSDKGSLYAYNSVYNSISKITNTSNGYFSTGDIGINVLTPLDGSFDPLNGKLYFPTYAVGQSLFGDLREVDTVTGKIAVKGSIGGISELAALAISGGTYKYSWAPATGLSSTKEANPIAKPTQTTTYTLTVTDACGATATSQVVITVSATKPPVAITATKDSICVGDSSKLSVTQKPGYMYQWSYNGTVINRYTDTTLMAGRGGNFQVMVTAGRGGCTNTSKVFKLKDCSIWLNSYKADTTCYSYFYPPHGYVDSGYRPNETYVKTVYPGSKTARLKVTFRSFSGSTFAKLNIYDGPGTSSKLIKTMSFYDYLNKNLVLTSSTGPLTFELISDSHTDNYGTWDAFFTCVEPHKYVSKQSGEFIDSTTWLIENKDGSFEDATEAPTYIDDSIIIRSGHTITTEKYSNKPVDELWIQKAGKLILSQNLSFADVGHFSLVADGDIELKSIGQLYAYNARIRGNITTEKNGNSIGSYLIVDGTGPQVFNLKSTTNVFGIRLLNKQGLTIHGAIIVDSLFMQTTGVLQADSIQVRKHLTLDSGIIHTNNSGVVSFTDSKFTLNGGNKKSYIDGPVSAGPGSIILTDITYPVGTSDTYRPLRLNFEKYVNDIYTVQAVNQPAPALPLPDSIDRVSGTNYYKIKAFRGYPFSSVAVTVPYYQQDGITDPANLRLVKDSAGKWYSIGGVGTHADTGTITSTARFSYLGNITLANFKGGGNVLPVNWLHFNAVIQAGSVYLQWDVSHEINVGYYSVEHSVDGAHFETLATVAAYNNGANTNTYTYQHNKPAPGMHYYRIKETDKDGKTLYTKIAAVRVAGKSSFTATPNPTRDVVNITAGDVIKEIDCYNAMGQLVKKVTPAANTYRLSLKQLAAGVYTIKVVTATETFNSKVVKE